VRLKTSPPSCAECHGNLVPSGPHRACYGTALLFLNIRNLWDHRRIYSPSLSETIAAHTCIRNETVIICGTVAVSHGSAEPQWDMTQCATPPARYSTAAVFVTWKGDTRGIPVECRSLGDTHYFTARAAAVTLAVPVGEFLTFL
jgi:hypothetical protein